MNDQYFNEHTIRELVLNWYRLLDVHAPFEDVQSSLAQQDLEFRLPETTLRTIEEFRTWYEGVLRIFFDEVHEVKTLDVTIDGSRAAVSLMVNWKASRWRPPAPRSERLDFDAY